MGAAAAMPLEARTAPDAKMCEIWEACAKRHLGLVGFDIKANCFIIFRKQSDGKTAGVALPEELNDMLKAYFLK